MRYPASETAEKHKRILDEAIRLFRERGFSDVSVGEIMKAAGLTHGPFYNHFASKEALIAECLQRGLHGGEVDLLDSISNSIEGKETYVKTYLNAAHRDSPGDGCVVAALAAEIRRQPQARNTFTEKLKVTIKKLASNLPWRSKHTARGDAILTLSALIGAIILSRAVDDETFSDEILAEVRQRLVNM
jgi:TetR/AcrR family transcriptional regulator, transcriptional repressor for nem operon